MLATLRNREEAEVMVYLYRNTVEEQKEACQKARQVTATCEKLYITLDPIDWQTYGLRASVTVNKVKISDLLHLSQQDSASILQHIQIRLFEQAALESVHANPGLKATIWSPLEVIQPQEFLSLWVITLQTNERVAIAEYIKNQQRVYERYELDIDDKQQLLQLFGPIYAAEYQPGDIVAIEEREQKCRGKIVYILAPGKAATNRKYSPKGYRGPSGKTETNEIPARYLVACDDGFPHLVNQSQISSPPAEE